MELGHSISTLYNLASAGRANQARELLAISQQQENPGLSRTSFRGAQSQADRIDQLAQRIEKISGLLSRLKQSTPALSEAPTVAVESPRENTASFTYSVTRDAHGNVTESYSFKVQYKPTGEQNFIEAGAKSLPAPASIIADNEPVSATPVVEKAIAPVKAAADGGEVAVEPLTFEEHVAKLIEYYRIAVAGEDADGEGLEIEDAAAVVDDVEADDHGHGHGAAGLGGDIINIDADYVSRIYSGGGDDVFSLNADTARRIGSGGGDDDISINADNVARIRSGAGDDTVNIEANNVRRIHTGDGDDVLNINADRVTRIHTGDGDDTLNITADTIARINSGDGDDVLNLTADTIKRVNAGAGDDTIIIDANDAAIAFGKGGGEDVINITSVGALAIQIDSALATSSDDYEIVTEGNNVKLVFASGESLTLNNVENAELISVRIGGELIDLHLSEEPVALDISA